MRHPRRSAPAGARHNPPTGALQFSRWRIRAWGTQSLPGLHGALYCTPMILAGEIFARIERFFTFRPRTQAPKQGLNLAHGWRMIAARTRSLGGSKTQAPDSAP